MAGKYGPASAVFLIDGYDMLSNKLKGLRHKITALNSDTTGLGDSFEEHTPSGVKKVEISQDGAFFDTTTNRIHDAMSSKVPATPQADVRIACLAFAGQTIGNMFWGALGAFSMAYEVLNEGEGLTKANVDYVVTGQAELGTILQELEAKTADWNTGSAESYDGAASSSAGGVGYLQNTAGSGFTAFVGTFIDSSDDTTFGTLLAMTGSVAEPRAERKTVSGTVERYLAFDGNVTGTGTITVWAGFARL